MTTGGGEAASPASVNALRMALGSADAEERRQATSQLGMLPLEAALPLLFVALGDEDWRVRKEATVAAKSFGPAPALLGPFVAKLDARDNVGLRNALVDVLAAAGPAATPALADAYRALDADGRKLVVETLGRAADPRALPTLEAALEDDDDNVRQGAIESIAALGPSSSAEVCELLVRHLDDRDRLVRFTALEGLSALEVPIPWERLEPLLEDATLRPLALAAAALSENPRAATALVRVLSRSRGVAFLQALRGLSRLADGSLVESVGAALRAEGPELGKRLVEEAAGAFNSAGESAGEGDAARRVMALGLASLAGSPGVVPAAIAALSQAQLAEPAERALGLVGIAALPEMIAGLGDATVPAEARATLVDVATSVVQAASDPAAGEGARALAEGLRALTDEPETRLAVRALVALARIGDAGDLALLAARTLSESRPVAVAAETALASLARRLPDVTREVALGLTKQGNGSLLPATIVVGVLSAAHGSDERDLTFLAHAATAGDPRARRAAVEAVAELRSGSGGPAPSVMEVLTLSLTDEEREVQLSAARALGRLASRPGAPPAAELLELVERSGAPELTAAAVRAIGEGLSAAYQERRSTPPAGPPSPQLVKAVGRFACEGALQAAVSAVESLAYAFRAGAPAALPAIEAALGHHDAEVVKAALVALSTLGPAGQTALAAALAHPTGAVRALAIDVISDADLGAAFSLFEERLAVETDRRVQDALHRALGLGPPSEGR